MDCLESRIEELVDEVCVINDQFASHWLRTKHMKWWFFIHSTLQKKRLNCTASETSIASILISLSNIEKHAGEFENDFNTHESTRISHSKIESDDDVAEVMKKLNNHITSLQANQTCEGAHESTSNLSKDKISCSPTELEGMRREKNRMHAKQTRLRKKKMTHEMGVVSTSSFNYRNISDIPP